MFDQSKFDPGLWENVRAYYELGGRFKFNDKICDSLDDFASEVYDCFTEFRKSDDHYMIFGMNGVANPIKDTKNMFYDGLVFYITRNEYIDCLKEYTVERLYSFLIHFGYRVKVESL